MIFCWSGEAYHRAWTGAKAPDPRLNRLGDHLSGIGALALGMALFLSGEPLLAATSGLLHAAGKFEIPGGDEAAELYAVTQEVTTARGLPAYEISNHAKPGAESRHNLTYWRYGEYIGVGPGAHGRFVENGRRVVTVAEKMPETWANLVEAKGHGVTGGEILTRSEEADEFLLMGLRLAEGIDLARYEQLSGKGFSPARLSVLQEEGLVAPIGNSRLRATPSGMIVLDAVVADLAR